MADQTDQARPLVGVVGDYLLTCCAGSTCTDASKQATRQRSDGAAASRGAGRELGEGREARFNTGTTELEIGECWGVWAYWDGGASTVVCK